MGKVHERRTLGEAEVRVSGKQRTMLSFRYTLIMFPTSKLRESGWISARTQRVRSFSYL